MKPRSANQFFVIALCVLALFVAQTFGKRADYLCVCSGTAVPTVASHCYGPHGQNCTDLEAQETSSSHSDHDQDHQGDRKEHQVVTKELTSSRPADAATQIVAPPVLLAVLPVLFELVENRGVEIAPSYSLACEQSPPFGVTVARTIVLLI